MCTHLVLVEVSEKRNGLDCLAKTHLIGEDSVQAILKESLVGDERGQQQTCVRERKIE